VLDEYQLLLICRGEGQFESRRGGRRRIVAGCVLLTFPGEWHRYRPTPSVGWDQYWVGFRGEVADRLAARGFLQPDSPVLQVGLDEAVLSAFHRLLERLNNEQPGNQQLMAGNILEILGGSLAAARLGRKPDKASELVQRAKALLEPISDRTPTVGRVAQLLGFSGAHFRRIFKRHTGMSPYQYQLQMRINRAREMLHGTTLSVRKIAAALGFENPYHFSAAFKRKTGVSPSQWRQGGVAPRRRKPKAPAAEARAPTGRS
jgi:AraC-like DNA-binding protein